MTNEGLARVWRACLKARFTADELDELLQDIAKRKAGPGGPAAVQARYESILSDLRGRISAAALAHAQTAARTPRPVAQVVYVRDEPKRLQPGPNPELDRLMGLPSDPPPAGFDPRTHVQTFGRRQ